MQIVRALFLTRTCDRSPQTATSSPLATSDHFAFALDFIVEGCLITGASRRTLYASAALERMTGHSFTAIVGRNCCFLQGPATSDLDVSHIRAALEAGETFRGRLLNYRKDRATFRNELSITPRRDALDAISHFVSVQRDVTDEVGLGATLRYRQEFDSLTGLPNRTATRQCIVDALGRARREGSAVAVGIGNIDRFRQLNHIYGSAAGDVMLEEPAFRVWVALGRHVLLGRMAADEFALVFTGLPGDLPGAQSALRATLHRVARVLREPVDVAAGQSVTPITGFGFAISPFDAREADSLLAAAETVGTRPVTLPV